MRVILPHIRISRRSVGIYDMEDYDRVGLLVPSKLLDIGLHTMVLN